MVTAAAKRELTEIHTSVHILEQREISAVPVAAQEDIFRSIGILPGIVSTSDVSSQFYVRGGAGDQNLILLDGIRIYNPYHAFGIFSVFDPDIVNTTEVYTGAYPADYGGRLSSVINMTTKDGGTNAVSGRANINFLSTKLQVDGPVSDNGTVLVSGRKSIFSGTLTKFLNKDLPISFYDGFAKLTFRIPESQVKYGLQTFVSGDDLKSSNPTEPDYSWRTSATGFVASGLIQNRVFFSIVGFQDRFNGERDAKQSKDISPASTSVIEPGVRANATVYTNSKDLFFFGFEFSFPSLDYITTNSLGIMTELKSSVVEASAYERYQTEIDGVQADLGICVDFGSLITRNGGIEVLQPRLNLSYKLWDTWKAKAAYGRFTQNMITVNNEDDVISVFDAWIQVPQNLSPSRLITTSSVLMEISSAHSPPASRHTTRIMNRSCFTIGIRFDAQDPDYISGTGKAYGLELLILYANDVADLYAAYTLGWTTVTSNGFTYYPRYDRRHNLNLLSVFHVAPAFDVTLRWQLGSGFPYTQSVGYYDRLGMQNLIRGSYLGETGKSYISLGDKNAARLPAYQQLDASASYRFKFNPIKGTVGVNIVNVYNRKNIFYFDRNTGQQTYMLPFFPTATLNIEY